MGRMRESSTTGTGTIYDCDYPDTQIRDGTFSFGVVREPYIRDCYFCGHSPGIYDGAKTVNYAIEPGFMGAAARLPPLEDVRHP